MGIDTRAAQDLYTELEAVDSDDVNKGRHRERVSIKDEAPLLSEGSEIMLNEVMQYFAWKLGEKHGVEEEGRQYLEWGDLSWTEYCEIVNDVSHTHPELNLPKDFVARLTRGDLVGVLFNGHAKSRLVNDNDLDQEIRTLADFSVSGGPMTFIRYPRYRGESPLSLEDDHNRLHNNGYNYLRHGREMRVGQEVEGLRYHNNPFLYRSELKLARSNKMGAENNYSTNWLITGGRFIECSGSVEGRVLENCTVVYGSEELVIAGCKFEGGKVVVNSGLRAECLDFSGDVDFEIKDIAENGIVFDTCDFSKLNLDKKDLRRIAKVQRNCVFSDVQIREIGRHEGADRARTTEQMREALGKLLITKTPRQGRGGAEYVYPGLNEYLIAATTNEGNRSGFDHAFDPERGDLERVKLLENAGLQIFMKEGRHSQMQPGDARRLFMPLNASVPELYGKRVEFLKAMSEFYAQKGEDTSFEDWMVFLIDMQGNNACEVLGFDPEFLSLPKHLDSIPVRKEGCGTIDLAWESYLKGDPVGSKSRCPEADSVSGSSLTEWNSSISVTRDLEFYKDRFDRSKGSYNVEQHVANSSLMQLLRAHLVKLFGQLGEYAQYTNALVEKHGYVWPQVVEDGGARLNGFSHPSLPDVLKERGGGTVVRNDIAIDASQGGVVGLTGANDTTGKSMAAGGISLAFSQAQAGAPVPAESVSISETGLFDHQFALPNERAKAGSQDSNFRRRALIMGEFFERVKDVAGTPEKPTRVLITMDEITEGTTDPDAATKIEAKYIDALMNIPGIVATVILITPNIKVFELLKRRHAEKVRVMVPDDKIEHCLVPGEHAAPSLPMNVLRQEDVGAVESWYDLNDMDWLEEEKKA